MKVVDDKVSSVETTCGAIEADMVVAAAGPQTGLMADMVGVHVPVAPARVEMLATAPLEPLFQIALVGNGLYGRQAARGNLLFGGGAHEWTDVGLTTHPSKPKHPPHKEPREAARRSDSGCGGRTGNPKLGRGGRTGPRLSARHRHSGLAEQLCGRHRVGPWIWPHTSHGQGRQRSGALRQVERRHQRAWAEPTCRRHAELAGGARLDSGPRAALRPGKAAIR